MEKVLFIDEKIYFTIKFQFDKPLNTARRCFFTHRSSFYARRSRQLV